MSLEIAFSEDCRLWSFPVKTVSQSEAAYELNYQGTAVVPLVRLDLAPGEKKNAEFKVVLASG